MILRGENRFLGWKDLKGETNKLAFWWAIILFSPAHQIIPLYTPGNILAYHVYWICWDCLTVKSLKRAFYKFCLNSRNACTFNACNMLKSATNMEHWYKSQFRLKLYYLRSLKNYFTFSYWLGFLADIPIGPHSLVVDVILTTLFLWIQIQSLKDFLSKKYFLNF